MTNNSAATGQTSADRVPPSDDPRRRILEAAYQVFAEVGRQGARTREIARRARVNVAMIHYYFSSKDDLYFRVITPIFREIFLRLKTAAAGSGDPMERLEAIVNVYFDFLKARPEFPRLMMWELTVGGQAVQKVFAAMKEEAGAALPDAVTAILREGQARGIFRPHSPDHAVINLVALCVFPFITRKMLEVLFPDLTADQDFSEARRRQVLDLLRHGLSVQKS